MGLIPGVEYREDNYYTEPGFGLAYKVPVKGLYNQIIHIYASVFDPTGYSTGGHACYTLGVSTPWGDYYNTQCGYRSSRNRVYYYHVAFPLKQIGNIRVRIFDAGSYKMVGSGFSFDINITVLPFPFDIIQAIDKICTTILERKPFFEISTPYDVSGEFVIRDINNNVIFRDSIDIMQGEGIPINLSLDEIKDAIDNPRFMITPSFILKMDGFEETEIKMDRPSIIDLIFPELELEDLILPDNFCPEEILEIIGTVRAIKCPSKVLAKISAFDEELSSGVFELKPGEILDLKTDLNLDWNKINDICSKYNLIPEKGLRIPIKFELFRYTNEIEKRTGVVTEDLIHIGSKVKDIFMRAPALLRVTNIQAPKKARPGYSTSVGITLENVGECPGEFNIKIGDFFETTDEFRPGERKSYTGTFVMGGEDFTPTGFITRIEGRTRREMPGITLPKILMMDTTALDTSKGLEIRAGDSEILFGGVMTGKNIGSAGGSKSIKEVYPLPEMPFMPNNIAILAGKVEPDGIETISADSVDYLKIKTSASLSYVLNGRVKNKDTDDIEYGGLSPARFITEAVVGKDRIEEIVSTFGGVV